MSDGLLLELIKYRVFLLFNADKMIKRSIFFFIATFVTVLCGGECAVKSFDASSPLEEAFDCPPQSAGAWAWWHWCGSNVSQAGITRDLEAMKDAGLGGATMFNIQAKGTEEPMENALDPAFGYRNGEYWRLLEFATAEAKRLGLRLGAHNCTGYSTAGGPWISPAQSMKKVVWTKAKIPAGATPESVVLPQPETVRGFYRDIGRVTVGDTVYRFGFTSTGKLTHPAPPDIADIALEADKMDAAAINHHWDNVLAGFLAHVPPSDPGFTHILIDSYEAGPSNWTWDFREEFTRRRGYDPVPKLPALDQAFSEAENARFASDLAQTVKELYTERYYDVSYARVKASGYELHLEPYSGPFDPWDAAARCDVPMTEFWQGPVPWSKTVREGGGTWMAGPVGRAYGRSIAGAESFTACPTADHWSYAPRHLKRAIDISLVQGINRFSLHDWVHQPLPSQYLPGFSMGFWGTHFGENQTWHEPGKAMYRYMQRCQALLQRGMQESDALGLVYTDDPTDDGIGLRDFLRDVDVTDDGRIRVVPSGRTYPLLLLNSKGDYAATEVRAKLQRLLADGATIAAPKGLLVPAGKGRLIEGFSRRAALSTLRIKQPFEVVAATPALGDKTDVRALGRLDGDTRFYFVANTSDTDYTLGALFRSAGKAPEIWFPGDGRKDKTPCWRQEGDRTRVDFVLPAHTSAFVVFDRPGNSPSGPAPEPSVVRTAPVAGPWRVSFQSGRGAPDGVLELSDLVSLTTRDEQGVRYFSGTATYETSFDLAERPTELILDLGDVRDIAEVELNSVDLGVAWYAPFRVNATRAAKTGMNRLVVKVTNCWQNRLLGDRLLPQDTPHDATGKKLAGEVQGLGIRRLPDWLLKGEKSPTGRICFTTWDYFAFKPNEPLAPSGLLGPAQLLIKDGAPYRNARLPVAERVDDLLGRMTVEEKLLQLGKLRGWNAYVRGAEGIAYSNAFERGFATNPPGTVYGLFRSGEWTDRLWNKGARPEDAAEVLDHFQHLAVEQSRLGIPVLFVEEAPHGLYVNGGTFYPTPIGLGATFDTNLLHRIGLETAREARGRGIRCVYGPVVDIAHDPRWSRVEECMGEDPELVAQLAAAMTAGLVESGVQPCVKHFLGGGASEGGHNTLSAHMGPYELYNVELRPWRRCIAAGARHVMSTYHDVDGEHCTTSPWMLTTLLREHLGFDGFVTSDAGATEIAVRRRLAKDVNDAAAKALRAGCDTSCGYWNFAECGDIYRQAYQAGAIDEADLDRAVRRVLAVKFAMGLFEHPYADRSIRLSNDALPTDLACEAAEKSIVLLKNERALPLGGGSVAVIGPNADAPMNQLGEYVTPPRRSEDVETVLEGIRRFAPQATYAKGCAVRDPSTKGFAAAERLAAAAETTILVLGGSSAPVPHTMIDPLTGATVPFRETDELFDRESGEGTDRCTLTLSGVQLELFRAVRAKAKHLVTVLVMGRPLELAEVLAQSDAVVLAWYPGSRGGEAVANVLFGKANPSGRLPISLPHSVGQAPVSCLASEESRPTYVDGSGDALLPFGFGLSYTTYAYGKLTAEKTPAGVRVAVDVVNTGKVAGEETVLVYLTALESPRQRPARELAAFDRVALAPGERKRVTLFIPSASFGAYDRSGTFIPGTGAYRFTVGDQTVEVEE